MRVLVLNGPNLNTLGRRQPGVYGNKTLADILVALRDRAGSIDVEVQDFQSNHEGAIIDYLQAEASSADGIIINPGALTHYGLSLRDALEDCGKPVIEVHISNIYRREPHRRHSVIAEVARGQIAGLGWRGYLAALDALAALLRDEHPPVEAGGAATRKASTRDTVT
ncbi:MAG: type II 3-dehydroquinate dehydratase [Dehalococcoidia bacterium]